MKHGWNTDRNLNPCFIVFHPWLNFFLRDLRRLRETTILLRNCCPRAGFYYTLRPVKLSRWTIALVLLNAVWLAVASHFLARHFAKDRGETRVEFVTNYVPVMKSARGATLVTNVIAATNDFRWAQLESEDYRDYIRRLRAIGCPEQTIHDIVIADVDKMLAPKMQAASPHPREIKYWEPIEQEAWDGSEQKDAMRAQRALDFEKREVIRELLGVDLVGERLRVQGQDDYHGQRLSFLPEEKRAQVRTVLDQFADQERELLEQQVEEGNGFVDTAEMARVRAQKEAALAPLFTPQEREQYDLWFSDSAGRVRDSVFGMNATEEEFLKLYQLQRTFDAKYGGLLPKGSAEWIDFQQQARSALGEQRYGEWLRAQDPEYRDIVRVTTRFKLSAAVATELYSYKQPIEEERAKVETDPNLSPQQKSAAFQAIADETQRVYKEALGEKAFRYYSRHATH